MKQLLISLIFIFLPLSSYSQIGYQVSLLNNATGEARANERVTVTVKITDSEGKIVCEETKNEISNDFGVVSMSVGDSETFASADWSKLPFFIEASVDGRLLGKSQLLSVPVAEHAKHTGELSKELLCSKEWKLEDEDYWIKFIFNIDGTYTEYEQSEIITEWDPYPELYQYTGKYIIDGNMIFRQDDGDDEIQTLIYSHEWKCLFSISGKKFK